MTLSPRLRCFERGVVLDLVGRQRLPVQDDLLHLAEDWMGASAVDVLRVTRVQADKKVAPVGNE